MLLDVVHKKQLLFARVLMDSWYASQRIMLLIDNLGKIYYCPLKKNRRVDDTEGIEKYQQIQCLNWTNQEEKQGIRLFKEGTQKSFSSYAAYLVS